MTRILLFAPKNDFYIYETLRNAVPRLEIKSVYNTVSIQKFQNLAYFYVNF